MSRPHFYTWFIFFALGMMGFTVVQDYIRPNYRGAGYVKYFLGVAPNYFAAIALCSFIFASFAYLGQTRKPPAKSRWLTTHLHYLSILISVSGLLLWEVMQNLTPHGYFDWHDMLWTLGGALTFYMAWQLLTSKTYHAQ